MLSTLRVLLIICICTATGWLQGQTVPLDYQGVYSGTAQSITYMEMGTAKFSYDVNLTVNASTWEFVLQPSSGGTPAAYSGVVAPLSKNLIGSATDGTVTIGGRLQVKGKAPLKNSLLGTLTIAVGDYWGVADLKVKLKKVPL